MASRMPRLKATLLPAETVTLRTGELPAAVSLVGFVIGLWFVRLFYYPSTLSLSLSHAVSPSLHLLFPILSP